MPELPPDPINYVLLARIGNREARTNLYRRRRWASDLHTVGFIGKRKRGPPHLLHMLVLWQHRQTYCDRNFHAITANDMRTHLHRARSLRLQFVISWGIRLLSWRHGLTQDALAAGEAQIAFSMTPASTSAIFSTATSMSFSYRCSRPFWQLFMAHSVAPRRERLNHQAQ